jgi:hypothetical protein
MPKVRCFTCNATIESKHRHDFQWCNCSKNSGTEIFIDGGNEYFRMGAGRSASWGKVEDE